ncbi:MAG: hypothetical protein ACSHXB_14710 [Sulfitobacter sp.]
MTVQEIFLTTPRKADAGVSAPMALLIGAFIGLGLCFLAQGTEVTPSGPDWHGNVASSEMKAH